MAFLETERIEREAERKTRIEVVSVMCPTCGISVVMTNGSGSCGMCGRDPQDDHSTSSTGYK